MATTYTDQSLLSSEPTFIQRVRQSVIAAAIAIGSDGLSTGINIKRHTQVQNIMSSPDGWKQLFATAIATQSGVNGLATQSGTVTLTSGNVAAQAALVTDAAIDAAVAGVFNGFFGGQ